MKKPPRPVTKPPTAPSLPVVADDDPQRLVAVAPGVLERVGGDLVGRVERALAVDADVEEALDQPGRGSREPSLGGHGSTLERAGVLRRPRLHGGRVRCLDGLVPAPTQDAHRLHPFVRRPCVAAVDSPPTTPYAARVARGTLVPSRVARGPRETTSAGSRRVDPMGESRGSSATIFGVPLADLRRDRTSVKWGRYDPDVIPMWIAEMDCAPCPAVVDAVSAAVARGDTGYALTQEYAAEIAAFADAEWGWGFDAHTTTRVADVLTGVTHLLGLLTDPGGPVVVSPPVYNAFYEVIEACGRTVVEAPLGPDHRLDLDRLADVFAEVTARGDRAAYLLSNPHNPTGTVHTPDEPGGPRPGRRRARRPGGLRRDPRSARPAVEHVHALPHRRGHRARRHRHVGLQGVEPRRAQGRDHRPRRRGRRRRAPAAPVGDVRREPPGRHRADGRLPRRPRVGAPSRRRASTRTAVCSPTSWPSRRPAPVSSCPTRPTSRGSTSRGWGSATTRRVRCCGAHASRSPRADLRLRRCGTREAQLRDLARHPPRGDRANRGLP